MITIVGVFLSMLVLSRPLTLITVAMVICMVFATKAISSKSGYYFVKQQTDMGNLMRDSANNANRYVSILMPVLGNLGYVSYAVIAMAGACLSIFSGQITLGTLASFLQFSRSFNQPISQLSQQLNSIIMAIARVAVANPPVLILDEATSSIDTRTEKIVQEGMDQLMKGRTVFVIAHRFSTIKNSDVIMVLDHGRIVERGNHDSLVAKKGMYYQLYTGILEQE